MAAYAARAGLTPLVLVPEGKIAAGKMAQAIVHGAQVIMVRGNFDDCLRLARGLAEDYPVALVNSVNPVRLEGQKTAAFEIVDFLGDAPDIHLLPVGNAGNISAYWMGYREYADLGRATATPGDAGLPGRGRRAARDRRAVARPGDHRHRDPDRQPGVVEARRGRRATSPAAGSRRSPTTQILAAQRELAAPRRRLRRAGLGGRRRRAAARSSRGASRTPAARSSSPSPATASRTPRPRSRASADLVDTVVDADVDAAAAAAGLA